MSAKEYKQEITEYDFVGVVEDIYDPKRNGRVKVRVERLHGRKTDENHIATEDLPWCNTFIRGNDFDPTNIGKIVTVRYEDVDYYNGIVTGVLHYDVNLQKKLDTLDDKHYESFFALYFSDKHQYYHDIDEGIKFDYVKSNINLRPNGDIKLNLRDNSSKLFLGTSDADQQAMLGNHWMEWFDELVQVLLGLKGGAYLGNIGAPIIPTPSLLEVLNKYLALRETFLSDHVFIVDDFKVKSQNRGFDTEQVGDSYNNENLEKVNTVNKTGYVPKERVESGGNPENADIKPNNFSSNLGTSKLPSDATSEEKKRETNPLRNVNNGEIPTESMSISKYLNSSFPNDERKYLLDEATQSLDLWLDDYHKQKKPDWDNIIVTKGYQNKQRQENIRKQYPNKSPLAGQDPFGYGNQVELYFGVDKSDKNVTDRLNEYLRNGNVLKNGSIVETNTITTNTNNETGFTYEVKSLGPKNWIVMYDNGVQISEGQPSFTATIDVLLEEQFLSLEGKYPNIRNAKLKGNNVNTTTTTQTTNIPYPRIIQEEVLDWLVKNGVKYKWRLAGRTHEGSQQWWHWIYDVTIQNVEPIVNQTPNNNFNPIIFEHINYGQNGTYTAGSTKTFKVNLNQDNGEWKIISLTYDYTADGVNANNQSYDNGIKNNGKNIIIDMEDFIKNELDLTNDDFKQSNLNIRFTVTANPIVNGKLDSNRNQIVKTDKFVIKIVK